MTSECRELFLKNDPDEGCNYPKISVQPEISTTCLERCKENEDKCCYIDCLYELLEIYADGQIKSENIAKAIVAGTKDDKKLEEAYTSIIEESTEKCINMSKFILFSIRFSGYRVCPI